MEPRFSSVHQPLQLLTQTLEKTYRITITDGRSFQGRFICVDKACNIILDRAEEFLPPIPDANGDEKVELMRRVRQNREMYWPKSERYSGGEDGGSQAESRGTDRGGAQNGSDSDGIARGREVGMILIRKKDIIKIEADVDHDFGDVDPSKKTLG